MPKTKRRWYYIGNIRKKRRSWEDELDDLIADYFTITTHGGGGGVWLVKEGGKYYLTVSTYGVGKTSRWSGRTYNVYTHYVIREDKIPEFIEKYFDYLKDDICTETTLNKLAEAFPTDKTDKVVNLCIEYKLKKASRNW